MDWNDILGKVIEVSIPIIAAFLIPVAKRAVRAFERRVKLDADAEEQRAIDKAVEEAVRATEEIFKGQTGANEKKENNALGIASKSVALDQQTLREKIKAKVNKIYNETKKS